MSDPAGTAGIQLGDASAKHVTMCGWDDVPHLDKQTKDELLASTPRHLRDARSKGIPSLGAGAIYPFEESEISVPPFRIPAYFRKGYALDVGWNKTAAIFGALDGDTDILYLYSEHYRGEEEPVIHAKAIQARGAWMQGVIDPASRGRNQADGKKLYELYRNAGLNLYPADNAVESGVYEVNERLATGRLKVFSTCKNWFAEQRIYRRDENGKIIKKMDHLMDATRYLVLSGIPYMKTQPVPKSSFGTSQVADVIGGY